MKEAKDKAEELIEKFYQESPKEYGSSKAIQYGIQCALICVDEILNYHISLHELGLKEVHQSLKTPKKMYKDVLNPQLTFWQQVKQEILNHQ